MIKSLEDWKETVSHGTSGDQVADILESWEADISKKPIVRDQIVVPLGKDVSVNVISPNETLLMRLNIFNHGPLVGPSIDVIFKPGELVTYKILSWLNGERIFDKQLRTMLISISKLLVDKNS